MNNPTYPSPRHTPLQTLNRIIWVENQSPNLNTLSCFLILIFLVHKRTMRYSPRSTIRLRIEALDEDNLLRSLRVQVIPFVSWSWPDCISLALTIRVDEFDRNEFIVLYSVRGSNTKRIFEDGLDRTPDIDNLVTTFEKRIGFFGKMVF